MWTRVLLATLVMLGTVGMTRADDKPLERSELDKRISKVVFDVASEGTNIFNKGNHEGCYQLYRGSLLTLVPMLDHRPKLQDGVKMHLDAAAKMEPAKGAFELRTALDDIQNDIAPPKGKTPMVTTLWDRLGGEKGVKAIVHDIVLVAAEDKKVDFLRGGKVKLDAKGIEHLEKMLVEFISSATGGPLKYEGKSMKEAHKGMMIADVEFDALVADMVSVLMKHKVAPADIAELGKIVESTRKEIVEKK